MKISVICKHTVHKLNQVTYVHGIYDVMLTTVKLLRLSDFVLYK